MTQVDFLSMLPLLTVASTSVALLLLVSFRRSHAAAAVLAGAGLSLALVTIPLASVPARDVASVLHVDGIAWVFMALLLLSAGTVVFLSYGYLKLYRGRREEFYLLLTLATLGSMVLVCSDHFVTLFLGLETLTVSLYTLIAYPYWREHPLEAGVKYLILAALSSAMLLFGMALLYAATGTMRLSLLAAYVREGGATYATLIVPGLVLILGGLGFKLALVPFHMWIPDVYEGAPAPAAAFLATVSKGGVIGLVLRLFGHLDITQRPQLFAVFSIIAIASMLVGNLLALLQSDVKRILAYSSIAHMGYLLVAFLAGGPLGAQAASFYAVAYFVTILGAFAVVGSLSTPEREAGSAEYYQALFQRRPVLAAVFTGMLLSLAGMPLTAGFVGKFYVVTAGVFTEHWLLIATLVASSTIGAFYYLRIIRAIYASESAEPAPPVRLAVPTVCALAFLTATLLWLGIQPASAVGMVQRAVALSF